MSQKKTINILQLYPRDMNIYGDWGNALTLLRRIEWHGYQANLISYNLGDSWPKDIDLVVGGGGQDSGQKAIQDDLLTVGNKLIKLADDEVPMLVICGLYQLFGRFFLTKDGAKLRGIGLLDIETHAGDQRLIGNITVNSPDFGEIIGYENHSGLTYLGDKVQPLGVVGRGGGNNGQDSTEGARYHNVIGSYLHGPLLPKNPEITDWLIERAIVRKYGEFAPTVIDDRFAIKAREIALKRPR